ncbi:MAG: selenide, water dikinase SelD [Deltaproteobacteria bacterium]|nr:selenide, water dikinase SelD [Deltaproteobacteria bacterium]
MSTDATKVVREHRADIILVGGGHAHVQILRGWMMKPVPGARLTVVVDQPEVLYSGMVPGVVAGQYTREQATIDIAPLAARAGARLVIAKATRIDARGSRVELAGRTALRYDYASLNVGSVTKGKDGTGVPAHAVATRPIAELIARLEAKLEPTNSRRPLRVVIVGAGAAGLELAFAIARRLRSAPGGGRPHVLTLLGDSPTPLPGAGRRSTTLVFDALTRHHIAFRGSTRVRSVDTSSLTTESGEVVPSDLTIWATGAAPPAVIRDSDLPHDEGGFVLTDDRLLVEGQPNLFAVGDCATITSQPDRPRAGVYAVRAGPILLANLRRIVGGRPLERYRPQRDFLRLLNVADGTAIGAKWGFAVHGRAVSWLKDRIDRRFMSRFQLIDEWGSPMNNLTEVSETMPAASCGGCAAKVGLANLETIHGDVGAAPLPPAAEREGSVVLGMPDREDVAAVRQADGRLLLTSTDGFRPFTDDPWLVGFVAAVHAASDLAAKGALPHHALAMLTIPDRPGHEQRSLLEQVMAGMKQALTDMHVQLIGGHTSIGLVDEKSLHVGLTISGYLEPGQAPLPRRGMRAGDALILTKPLGTGVIFRAHMLGRARGSWYRAATHFARQSNLAAGQLARSEGVHAATDVTGFGLVGHLGEMLRDARLAATLHLARVPALPGALALLSQGIASTYHEQNRGGTVPLAVVPGGAPLPTWAKPLRELIHDPQTSGGLLVGVGSDRAHAFVSACRAAGYSEATVIGDVVKDDAGPSIRLSLDGERAHVA